MKIVLSVKFRGHVPSFKNKKRIRVSKGKPISFTESKTKQWMNDVIQSFESQLFSATQTIDAATLTAPCPRSLIVSSLPLDDSRQWIAELKVCALDVDKGSEGAIIIIEPI